MNRILALARRRDTGQTRELECDANGSLYMGGTISVGDVNVTDRVDRLLGRTTFYDILTNGTLAALNATVEIDCSGLSTIGVGISGTWVGTIVAEVHVGDAVWDTVPLIDQTLSSASLSTTSNGNFLLGVAGALRLRLRASAWASGTATVYLEGTAAPGGVFLTRPLPTGTNHPSLGDTAIGAVADAAVITDVAGTLSGKIRGLVKWAFERMPAALGQQTMALSFPVVLPSNQTDVPVRANAPYTAVLGLEAVAATTMYQLIDISDAANYPHTNTNQIILKRLRIHAEKATDGVFDVWVGVVIENDGTDGTAKWLHCFHLEASGNPTDSTDRFATQLDFNLDLQVSGGALVNYVTNEELANDVLLQNDVARTSPTGTGNPGVGDLMVYVEEVSGAGTLDFVISADYDTA